MVNDRCSYAMLHEIKLQGWRQTINAGAREMVKRYSSLWKNLQKRHNPRLSAKLFLLGLALCENEETFKFVKEIDFIDVRKAMQQANPDLFEEFLENIISKRDRPAR